MTAPAIPLVQQIEEVKFAVVRQRSLLTGAKIHELRKRAIAEHGLARLETAVRTLETLAINANEIRAFLKLPAEARLAVLKHGEAMAQMCLELASKEAIAKAGGPVR
ncbi:MAG: hypothetical protein QHC89_01775 [Bosea sp. (in: a-proteobacteria)]|nr:hypothetical protein [Bosea sp. (in: a-proteobacteria)]